MFRWYGILGILMILFTEINFFLKIEPFASKYFIIIWLGYILVIDALNYKLRKISLMRNNTYTFLGLFLLSAIFWWIFEGMNLKTGNWNYVGLVENTLYMKILWRSIYFSTVLPAFFETYELIRNIHLFDKIKLKRKHKITKNFLHLIIGLGVLTFLLSLILPRYFFPLVWVTFFLILDPINYLHKQPSVIGHLKDRKLVVPLSLLIAGIIMGFFWELWNYYAVVKWYYNVPFVGFFKVFEMPILGYLGYFPFAFELYAMYWFVRSLVVHKEHMLED